MPRRLVAFAAIAVVLAAVFVRLGIWQLHRLDQRRARNALVSQRLVAAPVDVSALTSDTADARFRRVRVSGTPDYEHELVLTLRSESGSPGLDLVTPLRRAGNDTAVLVNRGWVFSADGTTVDETQWQESDTTFVGYAELVGDRPAGPVMRSDLRLIREVDRAVIARAIPYPVASVYVVATDSAAGSAHRPRRLKAPPLDEGPHLSYAIQWFSFAAIAIVGAAIVIIRGSREEQGSPDESLV